MGSKKNSLEHAAHRLTDQAFIQRAIRDTKMAIWLFQQPDVSLLTKLVPLLGFAYVLAPIDLIPDFIPVLGQLDDVAFVVLGVQAFLRLAPPAVLGRYEADQLKRAALKEDN